MPAADLQRRLAGAFVAATRRAPERLRGAAMAGPARNLIAAQIIAGMAREFDGQRGADVDAVVRWEVGEEDAVGGVWDLVIRNGGARAARASNLEPETTIGLDHRTLLELAVGLLNAPQAYLAGRLRMRGDVMLAQRMTTLIRVPGGPRSR